MIGKKVPPECNKEVISFHVSVGIEKNTVLKNARVRVIKSF